MGRGNSVTLRNKINGISSWYNPDMMLVGKMSGVSMCHSALQTERGMTFLHEKHGFKWGMKNPAGWTLTWIFDSFFTKSEKSSNHLFKNLKDQRFKSKGMKKSARGKKISRWMEKSR